MLPNILSLTRVPLAFLFLSEQPAVRTVAVLVALLTDFLDGFLARRWKQVSQLGVILDPVTDRFFVLFGGSILFLQTSMRWWMLVCLLSREILLFLFWIYLKYRGLWDRYSCQAVLWGKITTVMQLCALLLLIWRVPLPWVVWPGFVLLGAFTIVELYLRVPKRSHQR